MTSANEKDTILEVVYKRYVEHYNPEADNIYADYNSTLKESGLDSLVFKLAFDELLEDKHIKVLGETGQYTIIGITDAGRYFFKHKGGYFKEEQKQERKEKAKRREERLFKSGPILVSLFALTWSVYNTYKQGESNNKIAVQETEIGSVINRLDSLSFGPWQAPPYRKYIRKDGKWIDTLITRPSSK
ncbi:hypothetical protein ACS5NO_24585 [Larkinella sp. GY13]|uniref:hypothetical protein n=1 Tax=Larkinella sp. GY13 TaxID=3453720 RepID=UPI003EE94B14